MDLVALENEQSGWSQFLRAVAAKSLSFTFDWNETFDRNELFCGYGTGNILISRFKKFSENSLKKIIFT